jgi:hypothetical protein
MSAALIVILVLALLFGGIGFVVEAAAWALFIAVVLLVAGVVMGVMGVMSRRDSRV